MVPVIVSICRRHPGLYNMHLNNILSHCTKNIINDVEFLLKILRLNQFLPQNITPIYYLFFTANWILPGGSGNTIRQNKQITHITQNNTTVKRNTAHRTTHTIKDTLHTMNTITTTII
jgi:hypothetical protein